LRKVFKFIIIISLFVFLTITTQIGGLILLLSLFISAKWKTHFKFKKLTVFTTVYLLSTYIIIPVLAPMFGRQKIQTTNNLKPTTYMTVLLNRNYVKPQLNNVLQQISKNRQIRFLDANFPFINKFPLLPHLSHNDGNKIDLSFIYEKQNGEITDLTKSTSGYGVFESPRKSEFDQISECKKLGYFQYDYPKYLTFGKKNSELKFSETENKKLINEIVNNNLIDKVFIEPHLVKRLNLKNDKIRYHGCRAVRHDDHIHIQIKNN
jgi:hypothetical protein